MTLTVGGRPRAWSPGRPFVEESIAPDGVA